MQNNSEYTLTEISNAIANQIDWANGNEVQAACECMVDSMIQHLLTTGRLVLPFSITLPHMRADIRIEEDPAAPGHFVVKQQPDPLYEP